MHAYQFGEAGLGGEFSFVINWREHRQPVLLARHIVVRAVARGNVNGPGAGFGGDEIGEDNLCGAVEEWMLCFETAKLAAFDFGHSVHQNPAGFLLEISDEFAHDDQGFLAVGFVVRKTADYIVEFRMHRDGEVGRQRPGRGRPNDHGGLSGVFAGDQRESNKHRRAFLVLVFHFRFGQRCLRAV